MLQGVLPKAKKKAGAPFPKDERLYHHFWKSFRDIQSCQNSWQDSGGEGNYKTNIGRFGPYIIQVSQGIPSIDPLEITENETKWIL